MTKTQKDDFEATRAVIEALSGFEQSDQERILRWAREKLGLGVPVSPAAGPAINASSTSAASQGPLFTEGATDIRSFVSSKAPTSDNQFVAVVAYFYRFQAPLESRKDSITGDDVLQACRLTGWARPRRIAQTMVNAHGQGLVDRAEGRGNYSINTVGENLVALTLPAGSGAGAQATGPRRSKPTSRPSKAARKTPSKKPSKSVKKTAKKAGGSR